MLLFSGLNSLDYFYQKEQSYELRDNKFKIETTRSFKSTVWHNSFFYRGAKLWNSLPEIIRCETSLNLFRNKLHRFDLNKITKLVFP